MVQAGAFSPEEGSLFLCKGGVALGLSRSAWPEGCG